MKIIKIFFGLIIFFSSSAFASKEIAIKNACMSCHSIDKKIIGPAYRDIANKYKGKTDIVQKLIKKVKSGGVGVWGQIPMPANKNLTDQDAKLIVEWILNGAK